MSQYPNQYPNQPQPYNGQGGYGYQQPNQGGGFGTPPPNYSQPQPAPKAKRSPMLYVGLGAGALLLVILLVGILAFQASGPAKGRIGENIKVDKYVAQVVNSDCSQTSLSAHGRTINASRGQYCVIALHLENKDDQVVFLSASRSKLFVGKDEYLANSDLNSGLLGNGLNAARLEPGASGDYSVTFDSPSANPTAFEVQVSSKGRTVHVDLKR